MKELVKEEGKMESWSNYLAEYMEETKRNIRIHNLVKERIKREIIINYPANEYRNVLEVGGGSGMFASSLSSFGYNVTIMDPKTVEPIPNVSVINENFKLLTDISSYDLIVSIYGCEAIDVVIKTCIINEKPFLVVPCNMECVYMQNRDNNSLEIRNINEMLETNPDIHQLNIAPEQKIISYKKK